MKKKEDIVDRLREIAENMSCGEDWPNDTLFEAADVIEEMRKNKVKTKRRVFIVAPQVGDDTVYHICSTYKKGDLLGIYGADDYEIEETISSTNIKGVLILAKTWAKAYGCKKVEVI